MPVLGQVCTVPNVKWGCASLVVLCNEWVILCNADVVLCNDGRLLCNVFLPCSTCRYSVIPLSQNLGLIGWVPHSDTLHTLISDYRERKKIMLNVEHRLMLQGGGWETLEGRGLHLLACVCSCARMHACKWLEDSVALVRMLDSPFAGSVATVVFPWIYCHLLLH